MKVTFLGTGTSSGVPEIGCECKVCLSDDSRDKRTRCSLLLECSGKSFVIDCGPDFRQQCLSVGLNRVDAVLLTHNHFDHIGGLEELRPITANRAMPIWCEPYVQDQLRQRLHYVFSITIKGYASNIIFESIDVSQSFNIDGIEILPIRMYHHKLPVVGFRIGNLAYLTDFTQISDDELSKIDGVEVLIIEALRHSDHISHISVSQALDIIKRISPSKSYLIHMNHQFGLHTEIEPTLPSGVFVAYDGLTFTV
ncbi:MAG: MBL fold metallo-hydrolase [Bacteroidales bacterium]